MPCRRYDARVERPNQTSPPSTAAVLRAMRESASDIANVRDGVLVSRAIVRHTRRLLGTDMAYLSLNDLAAGETYIHVTDGVRTEAYRSIRMPLGTGVLGAVAAGGAVVQTADYLSDSDMNHLPDIDEIVREEGVVAIMGAPLRVGGRVIGGLLVADRTATHFPRGAVEALERMAELGAIAVEQSRLVAENAALATQVKSAEGQGEERLKRVEKVLRLDDQMVQSLVAPTGLTGVAGTLSEAVHMAVGIHDARGRLVAGQPLLPRQAFDHWEVRAAVASSTQSGRSVGVRWDRRPYVVVSVTSGDEQIATLVARGPVEQIEAQLLERAATFVGAIMLFERSLIDAYNRAQSALFDDLVSDRSGDRHALTAAAQSYGITATEPSAVLAIATSPSERYQALNTTRAALRDRPAVVSLHGSEVCVILGSPAEPDVVHALSSELVAALRTEGMSPLIGIGHADGSEFIAGAHHQAHRVLAAEVALGWRSGYADAVQLGLAGLLLSGTDRATVDAMLERTIGPLTEYDETHSSELRLTAWTYFECGTHLESTATRLFLHRNTVRQRAERIDALLGPNWRRAPWSADIHLALRVWRLSEAGLVNENPSASVNTA
ncbi:DNA-binding transcriptional regulator, PucR family [Leifsonia sp. 157MF]|nr:DNA-binding transcriptional regulator, PucR family [Leifsonia sp. 197AMF]SDK08798.1 DNA-binding transcriptional regulator, PucR family [Leifsonia sp. 157MF]SEN26111.1 DNA-binding transcriptional regulator, PucR family [Leifsonia sp. 467MF]